jgi:hypothetical protein
MYIHYFRKKKIISKKRFIVNCVIFVFGTIIFAMATYASIKDIVSGD